MDSEEPRYIGDERGGEVVYNEAIESYKSMFNFIKAKRDTDIKVFNGNKIITRGDIINLNQSIQNKLHLHSVQGNLVSISLTFSDSDVKTFGNWGAFESQEWNHACYTHSIVIEWDFSVIFPNHVKQVPQPHSMRLRIGAGLRPNEFFQVVMTGAEDHEISEAMANVVFKIDFVNLTLSSELKQIVVSWYATLPNNEPDGLLIRLGKNHSGKIVIMLNFLFLSIAAFIINFFVIASSTYLLLNTSLAVFRWTYFYISFSFPVFYTFWRISNSLTRRVMNSTIYNFKKPAMIRVTKGDFNRLGEINTKNKKLVNDLVQKIAVTLIVGILLYIVRDFIPLILERFFRALK